MVFLFPFLYCWWALLICISSVIRDPMAQAGIVDLPHSLLGSLFEIVILSNGNPGDVARLAMVRAQLCCVPS